MQDVYLQIYLWFFLKRKRKKDVYLQIYLLVLSESLVYAYSIMNDMDFPMSTT